MGLGEKSGFLIARPEKALLDYVYFASKGLANLDWEEIDITRLEKKILLKWAKIYGQTIYREIKKHL